MSVRSAQSITVLFTTRRFDTGSAVNADSLPTGTLYVNGSANGASVTVANVTTGLYTAAVTLPTLAVGDIVEISVAATVNSISDKAIVWRDTKDVVIDSAGLVDANTVKLGPSGSGSTQTARDIGASVLLSSGAGTGQLDFTSGVVKSNAVQLIGTTLTESASGRVKAAFTTFFDIATPVLTTASVNQTGDNFARIGATGSGLTSLAPSSTALSTAQWTNTRAGYLDNLNVGGAVASQADVQAVNQSASKHLLIQTVGQYERPESGSTTYTVEARTFSASTGAAVNADSTPTLTATGQTTGDLSANLGVATNPATGVYRWTYAVASNATQEPVRFDVSATISSSTYTLSAYAQVVDVVSATWTTTNATQLAAIYNKLPSKSNLAGTDNGSGAVEASAMTGNFPGSVASVVGAVGSVTGLTTSTIAAAVRDVSNSSPAAGSLGEAVRGADAKAADLQITLGTPANSTVSADIAAVNAKTTNLPADPAGLAALASAHGGGSWATATGFSTHTAADVWGVATRTLSAFAFSVTTNALAAGTITATSIADGAITDAKITVPAEAAGRPTTALGFLRRAWEWATNKRTRDRSTGAVTLYGADNTTVLETQTQATASTLDSISKGA